MNSNINSLPRIKDPSAQTTLSEDLFNRAALADKLKHYVLALKDGCVIGIDAQWGDGKTWLARYLLENWDCEFKIVYLDAFKYDYAEDPFTIITGEIIKLCEKFDTSPLIEKGVAVGKMLLPTAGKIAINAIGNLLLGTSNLSGKILNAAEDFSSEIATITEQAVKKELLEHDAKKKTLDSFRNSLQELSKRQGEKPIVFLIDELDRCRPTFSVQMLERLKHFFDVPNLVFILFLDRNQLENSIKGVYGQSIDAHRYLEKFVRFFLKLPKQLETPIFKDAYLTYCENLSQHFKLNPSVKEFNFSFSFFSRLFGLSLRSLESGYTLYALNEKIIEQMNGTGKIGYKNHNLFGYIVAVKLAHPKIFGLLFAYNDTEGHEMAAKLLDSLTAKVPSTTSNKNSIGSETFHIIKDIHSSAFQKDWVYSEEFNSHVRENKIFDSGIMRTTFRGLITLADLSVSD